MEFDDMTVVPGGASEASAKARATDPGQCLATPWGRGERLRRALYRRFVRPVTERIAWRVCGWTRWTMEPGTHWRRGYHTALAGLHQACWTHVCGHGLRYAFDIGCIYWAPRYAKRRLRLPDPPADALAPRAEGEAPSSVAPRRASGTGDR